MGATNSSWRRIVSSLGLVLALSATACNGRPTEPSLDDLIQTYTGVWRGNINGLDVVLDVRASRGELGLRFGGTGTARSATGESHRLRLDGGRLTGDSFPDRLVFLVERGGDTGPGSVFITSAGDFAGELSRDGLTWSGRFTSASAGGVAGGAPIFGPSVYDVTLTKD